MAVVVVKDQDPLTKGEQHNEGDLIAVHGTIALGTYVTNGVPVTPGMFGLSSVLFDLHVFPTGAEVPVFDKANLKVKSFTADGVEAANASDQSAVLFRYKALGR